MLACFSVHNISNCRSQYIVKVGHRYHLNNFECDLVIIIQIEIEMSFVTVINMDIITNAVFKLAGVRASEPLAVESDPMM